MAGTDNTIGHFYARRYGGGLRKARKPFVCQGSLCLHRVQAGEHYFDTMEPTQWPKTKRICEPCSRKEM